MYIKRDTASKFIEILSLDLPQRAETVLLRNDILQINQLTAMTPKEVAALDGIGKKTVADIKEALRQKGLELCEPTSFWRTMDTAPKDGRVVILWRIPHEWLKECVDKPLTAGRWDSNKECWVMGATGQMAINAAYWMPLPSPPEGLA